MKEPGRRLVAVLMTLGMVAAVSACGGATEPATAPAEPTAQPATAPAEPTAQPATAPAGPDLADADAWLDWALSQPAAVLPDDAYPGYGGASDGSLDDGTIEALLAAAAARQITPSRLCSETAEETMRRSFEATAAGEDVDDATMAADAVSGCDNLAEATVAIFEAVGVVLAEAFAGSFSDAFGEGLDGDDELYAEDAE